MPSEPAARPLPEPPAAAAEAPLLRIGDLHKSFGDNHVLQGVSLELKPQENLVIVGKSGSGKSVLLKCIVRLLPYDSGRLEVFGSNIAELKQQELDALRSDIGFLFQGSALYDSMTVRENLQFPLRRHPGKARGKNEEELIRSTLAGVGLEHTLDMLPEALSGGMKRRVALARALILRPRIILYDEPTTGLDPVTARGIMDLILQVQEEYRTASLIITHDLICARRVANRVIILLDGRNYEQGSFQELANSADPRVREFFVATAG